MNKAIGKCAGNEREWARQTQGVTNKDRDSDK